MRVLVTGATGFVGRWLMRELDGAGHQAIAAPGRSQMMDITDAQAVARLVADVQPQAIAHLAGISLARDAASDPGRALEVNEGGTRSVMEAATGLGGLVAVLVSGSSEVYGRPDPAHLPLTEHAPLLTEEPYGRSKLAQEAAALEIAAGARLGLVVTRSFNHIGPGQRTDFVVPALASRVLAVLRGEADSIPIGNPDVRRDFTDVRDVVRAYRQLLEAAAAGTLPRRQTVINVASGRSVSIRALAETLKRLAGCKAELKIDSSLVRPADVPDIVGSAAMLEQLIGWTPTISLEQTLADVLADVGTRQQIREG